VVLERDTRPDVAEPESAYGGWQRRGVPQFRHSHAFLARLRLVLLAHLPEVLDRLRALGVRELGLAALAPPGVTLAPEAADGRAGLVGAGTGRRSRAPAWLAASGAPLPLELSADTGTFYYTRFYRRGHGRAPRGTTGLVAGDLGWVKVAIFPGDNASFSISVGAPVADGSLRGLSDPARFEAFVRAFPAVAPWRARGVSVPIDGPATPVLVM